MSVQRCEEGVGQNARGEKGEEPSTFDTFGEEIDETRRRRYEQ